MSIILITIAGLGKTETIPHCHTYKNFVRKIKIKNNKKILEKVDFIYRAKYNATCL